LKVQLSAVDSRNIGTTRRLELAERSARRLQICYSVEWSKVPWRCVVQNPVRHKASATLCFGCNQLLLQLLHGHELMIVSHLKTLLFSFY